MSRYLITGGAGFIGSHLAESLIANGHAVRVLDNFFSGRAENLPSGVEIIRADVTRQEAVSDAMEGVDGCFHLAAIASVESCRKDWLRSHVVNLSGAITVFDEARKVQSRTGRGVPVVYASSAAVYGNTGQIPLSEEASACPVNAYGVDKLSCEMHAAIGAQLHDLAVIGLRFFNIYGPRQDPNSPYSGVVSIFCQRILEGAPIEIHGDGTQVRDFVHVDDAVNALRLAMRLAAPRQPLVFNVCTGTGTRIGELARIIAEVQGVPFAPRYVPSRIGDVQVSIGNPRKARRGLGFSAEIALAQGLARTLAAMPPEPSESGSAGSWSRAV
ncbi:MAG: NAD-dependent epimerase/dehydratase family protein [Alphaproteobacteria bacterium]